MKYEINLETYEQYIVNTKMDADKEARRAEANRIRRQIEILQTRLNELEPEGLFGKYENFVLKDIEMPEKPIPVRYQNVEELVAARKKGLVE